MSILQYETSSSGGWNREEKEEEMFSKESRHLVMMDGPELIAFSHFRQAFSTDFGHIGRTEKLICKGHFALKKKLKSDF